MLSGQLKYIFKAIKGKRGSVKVQLHFNASVWVNLPSPELVCVFEGGGDSLPKDVDTESHGKLGPFIQSIYHRHIENKKPVIFSHLDEPTTISGGVNL